MFFVKCYLAAAKKVQKSIGEKTLIKVVAHSGKGSAHQPVLLLL